MRGVHALWADLWAATLRTADSVRTDTPQALHDFSGMSHDEFRTFFRGLHGGALATGRALAQELGFERHRHRHLLDVGGGSGGVAIGACEAARGLRATVADLPSVTGITRDFVADAGMAERIAIAAADLRSDRLPGSFDVAVLRHLLQTLSAEAARTVLANVGSAVEPGGRVHILGHILDDSRLAPHEAVSFDIVFLNIYGEGACYTIGQHADWLRAAGFTDVEHGPAPAGCTPPSNILVSARKA
jgi:cyclopropane fatty-acyl-phospholipid synthase-like methyltransferase